MSYETGLPLSIRVMRTSARERGLPEETADERTSPVSHSGPTLMGWVPGRDDAHHLHFYFYFSFLLSACVNFLSCYNKLPQTGWLKVTKMYSLMVLETRSPKSRCCRATVPPKALGKNSLHASSSFRWPQTFTDLWPHHWYTWASLCTWSFALRVCFICFCLAHMRTFVFRPTWIIQGNLLMSRILNVIISAKTLFSK